MSYLVENKAVSETTDLCTYYTTVLVNIAYLEWTGGKRDRELTLIWAGAQIFLNGSPYVI